MAISGGVPGADETRNPGIGDPSWIKENLGQSPPLPVGTGLSELFGSTVRTWITSPIMIYDC